MRRLAMLLFVPLVLPVVALAQGVTDAPALPWWQRFLTPEGILSILVSIASLVGGWKWLTTQRKRQLATAAHDAYRMVLNQAAITEGEDALDKVALGFKFADQVLLKAGWRELSTEERETVKLEFDKLHGDESLRRELAAVAGATTPATTPAPGSP